MVSPWRAAWPTGDRVEGLLIDDLGPDPVAGDVADHEHAPVEDLHQCLAADHLDGLARQPPSHRVTVTGEVDGAVAVHHPGGGAGDRGGLGSGPAAGRVALDDGLGWGSLGQAKRRAGATSPMPWWGRSVL